MFRNTRKVRYIRVVLKAGAWKRGPARLLRWRPRRSMPSTRRYDLVPNDDYDTRVPLHPEEAFEYGITFQAKYIGTMDVPRPTSRVEIVAAMRRVRYEFKARGVKKRKVTVDVSVDGVRVTTRTNGGANQKKRSRFFSLGKKTAPECIEIMHHPIYRIFYVSHDSADLNIFSYIARDGATDVFKCSVFKSTKKSQAMKIVRTVGQAFEVCHKMQANPRDPVPSTSSAPDEPPAEDHTSDPAPPKEAASECGSSEPASASASRVAEETRASPRPKQLDLLPPPLPPPQQEGKRSAQVTKPVPSINLPELPECVTKVDTSNLSEGDTTTPLSAQHHVQLLREQLEQQSQQTRAAVAQLLLLRDQLAAEQAARCEAQARTHQLLVHNKELLEHIAALVAQLQEKEKGNSRPISAQQLTLLPQMNAAAGTSKAGGAETVSLCNGNCRPFNGDALIDFIAQSNQINQNVENNNIDLSNCRIDATAADKLDQPGPSSLSLGNMTNDQIQNYLVAKFQDMAFPNGTDRPSMNKHFYQNCKAFPHIPPLSHHCSNSDLANFLRQQCDKSSSSDELGDAAQAMSLGHSQNSLCSTSQPTTSKDSSADSSSDEAAPFIMPLSHNGTLTATGEDGRVRLIVPVSPSSSAAGLAEPTPAASAHLAPPSATLQVPGAMPAPAAPITRSTSEKVPNRSEMMTALRSQWTRHTTK